MGLQQPVPTHVIEIRKQWWVNSKRSTRSAHNYEVEFYRDQMIQSSKDSKPDQKVFDLRAIIESGRSQWTRAGTQYRVRIEDVRYETNGHQQHLRNLELRMPQTAFISFVQWCQDNKIAVPKAQP